ncbi:FAD-binding monooxygenase [Streptomyces spiroverticillatus]|uniref:FAD-binding monooxygenase n=1 Tax=Streptomyces finlayi TaxID=67296 RepID=A0A918X922_9ACTN|nr:monooxygenase [Streptomyces finlayi]GHA44181.1 FAD-binding monooxygenase [Streptomyces spiroverticillatus]GHD17676.1 FAD-binding monooxygenase [Streptomyces finlayi]
MGVVGGHAVIVGGSIGGLVAARALSRRFTSVTVVDRDALPDGPYDRKGVPQSPHAHALLISGRKQLEEFFPGLTEELIAGGAVPFDPGQDLLFHQMGALRVRFRSGRLGISLTRAYLEHAVRRRVAALPNVRILDRTAVSGLFGVSGRVLGVDLDDGRRLGAELVVDATGRSAGRTERWLELLDCPAPRTTTVKIDVGYTTRVMHRQGGELHDDALLYLMSAVPPHDKRAAAVFAVEGNRWMVTLGGWHRSHAPVDPEGFAAFADDLPDRHVADLLARTKPVSEENAERFLYPAARRRWFEKLDKLPAGYVALGDAICSFNPLYGQGMTVATLEAVELGRCLDRHGKADEAMARRFYRAAARVIDIPWQMSTSSDFMYPETVGAKGFGTDLLNRYVRQVMMASHVSVPAHRVMLDLQHLLARPPAVLRPDRVVRALIAARRSPAHPAYDGPAAAAP